MARARAARGGGRADGIPGREAFNKDLSTKLETARNELIALETQIKASPQNAPETQTLMQNYQQRGQEFEQNRQRALAASDEFNARQIAEAYRRVVDIVNKHAEAGGYTHVIATRGGAPILKSTNIAGTVQEMLARPLIKGIQSDDLTKGVLDELKLPDMDDDAPAPTAPTPPEGGATPPATPNK